MTILAVGLAKLLLADLFNVRAHPKMSLKDSSDVLQCSLQSMAASKPNVPNQGACF